MEIFVQSRGFSRRHDYRWQKLPDKGDVNLEVDSIPPLYEHEIKALIDTRSDVFSLVFGRSGGQLYLLVSGLPSSRKDVNKRFISNSVMWVSDNADGDEPYLRSLAVHALQSQVSAQSEQLKLEKKLDSVIVNDDDCGFSVNFEQLHPLQLPTGARVNSSDELAAQPVEVYSERSVLKLANELKSKFLPKGGQNLVVVTGNKSRISLDNSRVLRGLSRFDPAEPQSGALSLHNPSSQLEGAKRSFEDILDKVKRHFFPSLVSVALTSFLFLATPVRNLVASSPSAPPCPPVPNVELLSSSRRFVVGEAAPLRGDYDPQKISKIVLLDETKQPLGGENQNIQLLPSSKTWKYNLPGFQVPGKKRLILQGFDGDDKMIIEQVIPAIVDPDSATADRVNQNK